MPYSTKSCTDCRHQGVTSAAGWFDSQAFLFVFGFAVILVGTQAWAQSPPAETPPEQPPAVTAVSQVASQQVPHETGNLQIKSLASRLSQYETDAAVALGNLDAIARIEKASKLRPLYDSMIETETVRLALRQSIRRAGQVSESTTQFASAKQSKRRVQMTAFSDRNRKNGDGVVTLLKRKRMRLSSSDEHGPPTTSVAIAKEFEPIRITPPPAEALDSTVEPPSTKIGLAKEVVNTELQTAEERAVAVSSKQNDAKTESFHSEVKEPGVQRNPYADPVVVVSVPARRGESPDQGTPLVIEEAKQFPVATTSVSRKAKNVPRLAEEQLANGDAVAGAKNTDEKQMGEPQQSSPLRVAAEASESPSGKSGLDVPSDETAGKVQRRKVASEKVPSGKVESERMPPEESVAEQSVAKQSVAKQSVAEQSVAEQSVAEQSVAEQSVAESESMPGSNAAPATEPANAVASKTASAADQTAAPARAAAPAAIAATQPDASVAMQWPFQLGGPAKIASAEGASDVTLSVNDVDVRVVFEMLSKGYGMNILVAPDVEGTVTANVAGLSPKQTLRSIVRMCGLAAQEEDGVILVYPRDNQPLESRVLRRFPLDYARSEILEPAIQGLLSPIGSAYASKSDQIDHRKGQEAIVVIDTLDVVEQVERYIMEADQPPRQVMIEARVLEVELKDDMEHGVNLEAFFGGDFRAGAFQLTESIATSTNPFFFSEINGNDLYAGITMLETTTDAKTLATPRVMVVNGQNAKIQVGQQLGFAVLTVTQTSTVQDVRYLDTGVVLDVTPTISREGKILMQVAPKVSSGEINPDTLLPEETTREVQTSVLLSNHHGMIIGGLIQEEDRVTIRKLPWLGDVKHVGRFFQQRSTNRARSEIIVALIPHIVEHGIEENCGCVDPMRDQDEWTRTSTPLFDGPLNRNCRPWEARLPDETSNGILFKDHLRQKNVKSYSKGCEPVKTDLSKARLGLH